MANTVIEPYLFFGGRCEEALAFYQTAIGAKTAFLMRYKESPEKTPPGMLPPGFENKVMHATFHVGGSILMASDGCSEGAKFDGFSLSICVPEESEAKRVFAALSAGGQIKMPLAKTFWSPCFGMVADKFGLGWMISVEAAK